MGAVAETLAEMKLPGTMALATKDKLMRCGNMKLAEHFGGEMDQSLDEILDILENRASCHVTLFWRIVMLANTKQQPVNL